MMMMMMMEKKAASLFSVGVTNMGAGRPLESPIVTPSCQIGTHYFEISKVFKKMLVNLLNYFIQSRNFQIRTKLREILNRT